MIIQCISDLHAGTGSSKDRLRIKEEQLVEFLEKICHRSNVLILNGDVFDTIEGEDWDSCAFKFMDIRKARPRLVEFIIDKMLLGKIIYNVGNTDWVVREKKLLPLVKRSSIIDYEGVRILAEHGHFPDLFGYKPFTLEKLLSHGVYWTERLFWKDANVKLAKFLKTFPASQGSPEDHYMQYAFDIGRSRKANIVLLGHSHKAASEQSGNCIYVDTGKSCDRKTKLDLTTITIKKGRYGIVQKCVSV